MRADRIPFVNPPAYCRSAWARFLKAEGCSIDEIGKALSLPPKFVESMLRRTSRRQMPSLTA